MNRYWFRAKRYGWGWTPATWQGWLATAVFLGLLLTASHVFPPRQAMAQYLGVVAVIAVAFIALCRWKGEPPGWRWGGDD